MHEYGRARIDGRPAWLRLRGGEAAVLSGPPWESPEPRSGAAALDPEGLEWLPPVRPSKIVCFARTYPAHAREMGSEERKAPLLFLEAPSALLAPGRPVRLPPESGHVDCEGELGLVVGRRVRRFPPDGDAAAVVAGWLTADDVTARDLQRAEGQWARGKSFDTTCPLSRTFWSEPPAADARLETRVGSETVQSARLDEMSFGLAELLSWASAAMTREPGDLA